MNFTSKRTSLIILAITALVCSRAFFALLNDPEGPNLLIVTVLGAIIYGLSLLSYFYLPVQGMKRLLVAIASQVVIVACLYFFLR